MPGELPPQWQQLTTIVGDALGRLSLVMGCGVGDLTGHFRLLIPLDWPHPNPPAEWLDGGVLAGTVWLVPIERSPHVTVPLLVTPLVLPPPSK